MSSSFVSTSSANTLDATLDPVLPSSRIWLITGATSGFGKRMALSVIHWGDQVIGTGRSQAKLDDVKNSIADLALREQFHGLVLDVTEGEEAIKRKIDQISANLGGIDVLVNNAGIGIPAITEEAGSKVFRRQFETNVFGVLDVTNATLPYLRQSKRPALVIIGSRSAFKAELPGIGSYASSKAAIHAIAETLMTELSPFNIPVLLVEPGAFPTEGILTQSFYLSNPMLIYDPLRTLSLNVINARPGTERGDPDKAVTSIVDVVKGEGVAQGRAWPNDLILGEDAEEDVRSKLEKLGKALDAWADVTRGVSIDVGAPRRAVF